MKDNGSTKSYARNIFSRTRVDKQRLLILISLIVIAIILPVIFFSWPHIKNFFDESRPINVGESKNFLNQKDNQQKYISKNLGVAIVAAKFLGVDANVIIKESESKIFLIACKDENTNCDVTKAQYIEMFRKAPNESLEDAIKNKFLRNSSEENCKVEPGHSEQLPVSGESKSEYIKSNILVAGMDQIDDYSDLENKLKACPNPYTMQNGLSYFVMSKDKPDRFYFVNIGQYGISIGSDQTDGLWQDNIEIL